MVEWYPEKYPEKIRNCMKNTLLEQTPMTRRTFTLTITPANPLQFSLSEFRSLLSRECAERTAKAGPGTTDGPVLSRYPPTLCGQLKHEIRVTGICQGADFLYSLARGNTEIGGENRCHIDTRDEEIRSEPFGIMDEEHEYEFITPWLALNQQNEKKFYLLQGKPARDAFMQKLLAAQLNTFVKSLEYSHELPIACTAHVRFVRERIDRQTVMIFKGRFRTNLRIPQYLGIGQSVSHGFGWVQEIPPGTDSW